MEFKEARIRAGLSIEQCAEYLSLSIRTVKSYDRCCNNVAAAELMRVLAGCFPKMARNKGGFSNWSFSNGYLYSDAGERFTSGDILAMRSDRELIKELLRCEKQDKKRFGMVVSSNVIAFPSKEISIKIPA